VRILGVDPGLRVTGYAVISVSKSDKLPKKTEIVEAGVIRTDAKAGIAERLKTIYSALSAAVEDLKPDRIVIEKLYAHTKHPATAILMGHARGVVCLVSSVKKIPLVSIASTHVKKAITGKGHASKLQVQRMIQHTLSLKHLPEPPDVADALAVALSYAFQSKL
jgi:crossover junction endodeoxyribonuclease RuvC